LESAHVVQQADRPCDILWHPQYPELATDYQTHGVRFFISQNDSVMYSPLCPVHKG